MKTSNTEQQLASGGRGHPGKREGATAVRY